MNDIVYGGPVPDGGKAPVSVLYVSLEHGLATQGD